MARPTKVNRILFTETIAEYITEDEKGLVTLLLSDREVAEQLSIKLGIEINSEYVRNFRRSQNIASGVSWGGKRERAGRPTHEKKPEIEDSYQDVKSLHKKCVTELSRMHS